MVAAIISGYLLSEQKFIQTTTLQIRMEHHIFKYLPAFENDFQDLHGLEG